MRRLSTTALLAATIALTTGCGSRDGPEPGALAGGTVPQTPQAIRVGAGPRFRPAPGAHHVPGMRCVAKEQDRFGAHLELFAAGRIVVVPAGIGEAPPLRRSGAFIRSTRCSHPLRTREPTGLIELTRDASLGELFAIWGRPLDRRRLLSFRGAVRAWVDGKLFGGDPRDIPLRRHAQIVLVVGPDVPVHATYAFPAGL